MRLRPLALLCVVAVLTLGGSARADYTYQFANSSGGVQNTFNINVGQTVDIRVYILETGGGTTLSSGPNAGLSAAGVQLNTSTPSIANVTAVTSNSAFDGGSSSGIGSNAFLNEFKAVVPGGVTAGTGTDANRVLVGTFRFTGISGGQTLTISALPGLNPDNVLGDGTTSIDAALMANSVSALVVVAVPEPSSLVLTCLVGLGVVGRAWKRRRTAVA